MCNPAAGPRIVSMARGSTEWKTSITSDPHVLTVYYYASESYLFFLSYTAVVTCEDFTSELPLFTAPRNAPRSRTQEPKLPSIGTLFREGCWQRLLLIVGPTWSIAPIFEDIHKNKVL
jgi:hypothetical protein